MPHNRAKQKKNDADLALRPALVIPAYNLARRFRAVPAELSNALARMVARLPNDGVSGDRPFGLIESSASHCDEPLEASRVRIHKLRCKSTRNDDGTTRHRNLARRYRVGLPRSTAPPILSHALVTPQRRKASLAFQLAI